MIMPGEFIAGLEREDAHGEVGGPIEYLRLLYRAGQKNLHVGGRIGGGTQEQEANRDRDYRCLAWFDLQFGGLLLASQPGECLVRENPGRHNHAIG